MAKQEACEAASISSGEVLADALSLLRVSSETDISGAAFDASANLPTPAFTEPIQFKLALLRNLATI
ncbi:MAG: hypothetical protein RO009_07850 [Pseudorhodoplanes sp.]|jgi:hypothetical protein|nr:hypothetical protein [Pseudorhodoplanes sp.]